MWTKEDVQTLAKSRVIEVTFKKKNGDTRVMDCTLLEQYLPPQRDVEAVTTRDNPEVLAVWDVSASGWRSFRIDSIISVSESPRSK